jgi:PAS domain S-box-containing protein
MPELLVPPLEQTEDRLGRFLWRLIEASPVAVVAVDQAGVILYANQKLADMFHYQVSDMIGSTIEILLPERYRGDHRIYRSLFAENPHTRPMGSGLDLAGRRSDGSEFPIEVGLSYFRSGDLLIVLGSITDITRRKQTEEILERRVEERTREIERRRKVADSLRDILQVLNSNRPLQEILDIIVAQARELLRADASAIYQLHEGDKPLSFQAGVGISPAQLTAIYAAAARLTADPHRHAAGAVLNNGAHDAPLLRVDGHDYCAQLAVPLKLKDELYGGLMLYYLEPRKFSAEEIELAVMFGDQAALAIENARLRVQAERAAVAAERNRIARDLHDSVTQTLFSASLIAEVLPRLVQRQPDESMRRLEELRQLTRGALAEMRTLLLELRPATLMEVSIEELLRQLTEAARGRARIPIELSINGAAWLLPTVKVVFYYVAQEALNNVAKHARADRVLVQLDADQARTILTIHDNGQGFDLASVTPEHLGLAIMRERAESIGATLVIDSAPGAGAAVILHWQQTDGEAK